MKPQALVLTGYGLNTDYELAHGLELAGAQAERVHLNDLILKRFSLKDYQIAAVPGGFAYADDLGAGKVMAERIRAHLMDDLLQFIDDGKLIFAACNGFQVIVKLGLLPGISKYGVQEATLTCNDSGRFEDRWVYMRPEVNSNCVFTRGIESLYLPVRHGEGKFVPKDEIVLKQMEANGQIALRYVDECGCPAGYPWNPNGSIESIAGISDPTGRIFGLMPHPEAYLYRYNHPRWTREELPEEGQGLQVFKNAVEYVKREL